MDYINTSDLGRAANRAVWISSVDEMPDESIRILCCNSSRYAPVAAEYRTYHPNAKGKKCWRTMSEGHKLKFTHWTPLMGAPKKDKYE